MYNTELTNIQRISIHRIGNKFNNEILELSSQPFLPIKEIEKKLKEYFFNSFKNGELYSFSHEIDRAMNELNVISSNIFENDNIDSFHSNSINIAKFLFEKSNHPNIKNGELYVVLFDTCEVLGEYTQAIGLFKSETKDSFLKVCKDDLNCKFNVESEQGVNINKLDKGCLIFNTEKEDGYIIAVVDNTNKGEDAKYWIDDFLHVRPRKDEYYNTHNVLSLCKNFVTKELPQQFYIQKADQADLLNRSVQFFKEKDSFDMEEFTNEIFAQPEVINSFNKYKENYEQDRDLEIADSFTISESAVKKQARAFKSVIKLDKNFHIYVHGNRNLIEQGEDEKGKFYKVYYQEES